MSVVIQVEKLCKTYRLGTIGGGTLRADFSRWLARLRGKPDPNLPIGLEHHARLVGQEFKALEDVSFEVKQGEILGIIGRNGAGKSTLLKILSRVTAPTSGEVRVKGRIASLLEVGTGFHPELTGRENIFLNGAILGMSKAEIRSKFDEIVDFSGVKDFIDTPVKRYSSGMYVRLAFAVAAHLEPEILIVDEVLAVGDMEFQKKCLGKMQQVSQGGRTVLFVSHSMPAVRALCSRGLLMKDGAILMADHIEAVTAAYMDAGPQADERHTVDLPPPPSRCDVWMESVSVLRNGQPSSEFEIGDRISLRIKFKAKEGIQKPIIGYLIRSSRGENIACANNNFLPSETYKSPVVDGTILCDLGALPLMADTYSISFWLCRHQHEQHQVEDALRFKVEERDIWGSGQFPPKSFSNFWWPTEFRFTN